MRPQKLHAHSVPPGLGTAFWRVWLLPHAGGVGRRSQAGAGGCRNLLPALAVALAACLLGATGARAEVEPLEGKGAEVGLRLGALGLSVSQRPAFAGAASQETSATPNFVLHHGRLTLSNGGPLASRVGEPAEAGLAAEVLAQDRLSLRVSLNLEAGRQSSRIPHLRGLHDIPPHVRGRLQLAWRLAPRWELMGVWRGDLTDRGTGSSAEVVVLHEWRPAVQEAHPWRVSAGWAAQWRDTRQANLVHGVSLQDASRSAFAAYQLDAGWTDARLFAHARRELGGQWVAYASAAHETLLQEAARSPITQRVRSFSLSLGLGRRF